MTPVDSAGLPSTLKLLSTILTDAIPRHIKINPAARKRGKGKKGQRRIAEAEKAEKVWPTPLQALLFAERLMLSAVWLEIEQLPRGTDYPYLGIWAYLSPVAGVYCLTNVTAERLRPTRPWPVLVDLIAPSPGVRLPPWPPAVPGQRYKPPTGCEWCSGSLPGPAVQFVLTSWLPLTDRG